MYYLANIAGYPVCYHFRYEETYTFFGDVLSETERPYETVITIPEGAIADYLKQSDCSKAYAEYMSAVYLTSNYLLRFHCCCFHSVAIKVDGKGYLITAASGVGKTTQYLNLKKLYGNKIDIINGDKPFIEFRDDRSIMIHSSPWRGKENFGSDTSIELAGAVFLQQGRENNISRVNPEDIVVTSLSQFRYYPDSGETIHQVCELERKFLTVVPLWNFVNKGDLESSEILFKMVLSKGVSE